MYIQSLIFFTVFIYSVYVINFATYLERLVKFSLLCNNICKFLMGTGHNFQR